MNSRRLASWCTAVAVAIGYSTPAAAQESLSPTTSSFTTARPGWYLSIGAVGAHLGLEVQDALAFGALGIDVDERGGGGFLQVGYAFAPGFALEFGFTTTEHSTGRDDVQARFHQAQLDAIAPLVRSGRFIPYVAGGLGGAGLELAGAGIDDTTLSGAQADFGGGIEVYLSRRTALSAHYRFAIQDFRDKSIETGAGAGKVDVDARGDSHTWGLRFAWSF